jgi:hypothetical protein
VWNKKFWYLFEKKSKIKYLIMKLDNFKHFYSIINKTLKELGNPMFILLYPLTQWHYEFT